MIYLCRFRQPCGKKGHSKSENVGKCVVCTQSFEWIDKRECLVIIRDNFCLFCIKTYVVTRHLNCLTEERGHNILF